MVFMNGRGVDFRARKRRMVLDILLVIICIAVLRTIERANIVQTRASIVAPLWIWIVDSNVACSSARSVVWIACAEAKETALLPQNNILVAKMRFRMCVSIPLSLRKKIESLRFRKKTRSSRTPRVRRAMKKIRAARQAVMNEIDCCRDRVYVMRDVVVDSEEARCVEDESLLEAHLNGPLLLVTHTPAIVSAGSDKKMLLIFTEVGKTCPSRRRRRSVYQFRQEDIWYLWFRGYATTQ